MTNGIKGIQGFQSRPIQDRFWEKVNKDGPMCERLGTKCWVWTGATNPDGYGNTKTDGHQVNTHRVSWELSNGKIPNGLCVLHKCDNPPCVRPDHLFLGTKQDNVTDMINKGRRGNPNPVKTRSGEHHPNHKLTNADVIAMRERYSRGGISAAALARIYKIDATAAWRVVTRRTWKNIE
jgi:hypothetical protein